MAIPAQRLPRYGHHPHCTPDWPSSRHVYRPRRPTTTPLYPVVQHHLETFLAQATESDPMGYGVPSWVEKDLRAYLRCGVLAHGFARVRCEDCGHERLLAPTSPQSWPFAGLSRPPRFSPRPRRHDSPRCGGSPLGIALQILGPRSRPKDSFPTATAARAPTSIAMTRSAGSFSQPANSLRRRGSEPAPTRRFLVCSR